MNTKKELSLNTQLTKLREINNLLKQSLSVASHLDSLYGGNRSFQVRQFIYSLRDLQYKLRGLKIKVSRSTQTRRLSVLEIHNQISTQLSNFASTQNDVAKEYCSKLQQIQILLNTVIQYCGTHKSQEDFKEEQDREVVNNYVKRLDDLQFPQLDKDQIDILRDVLIEKLETITASDQTKDELF